MAKKELDKPKQRDLTSPTDDEFGRTGGRLSNFVRRGRLRSNRLVHEAETKEIHSRADLGEAWIRLKNVEKRAREIEYEHKHLDEHLENHSIRTLESLRIELHEIEVIAKEATVELEEREAKIDRDRENAAKLKEVEDLEAKVELLARHQKALQMIEQIEGRGDSPKASAAELRKAMQAKKDDYLTTNSDKSDKELAEGLRRIEDASMPAIEAAELAERAAYFEEGDS